LHFNKKNKAWIITLYINSEKRYLGSFKTEQEAYTALCKYKKENGLSK